MQSPQPVVREATFEDLDVIVKVHSQARAAYYVAGGNSAQQIDPPGAAAKRRESWTRLLRSDARVLCALWADQVVGIALMALAEPGAASEEGEEGEAASVGELYALHVAPSHWSRGVGSRLHAAYVAFLQSSSISTGELEVWHRNSRAMSFYSRLGWQLDGRRREDADGVYLRMRLNVGGFPE